MNSIPNAPLLDRPFPRPQRLVWTILAVAACLVAQPLPASAGFYYDLRFADGSKSKPATPGLHELQLWGRIEGNEIFTDDSFGNGLVAIHSQQVAGGAFSGNGQGIVSARRGFNVNDRADAKVGTGADWNLDSVHDWGGTKTYREIRLAQLPTSADLLWWRGGDYPHYIAGQLNSESQPFSATGWEVLISSFQVRIDGFAVRGHGKTLFDVVDYAVFHDRPVMTLGTLLYYQDGLDPDHRKTWGEFPTSRPDVSSHVLTTGPVEFLSPGALPDPTLGSIRPGMPSEPIPEPSSLLLALLGASSLLYRFRYPPRHS